MTYLDKTFCVSEGCKNKCGRKLTPEIEKEAEIEGEVLFSCADFCNKDGSLIEFRN